MYLCGRMIIFDSQYVASIRGNFLTYHSFSRLSACGGVCAATPTADLIQETLPPLLAYSETSGIQSYLRYRIAHKR